MELNIHLLLLFCPVGTPYALDKRTGLILADCISLNLYDTKLFVYEQNIEIE